MKQSTSTGSQQASPQEVREDIEKKYASKKTYLLKCLKRSLIEQEQHMKFKDSNRYKRYDEEYGQTDDFDLRRAFNIERI